MIICIRVTVVLCGVVTVLQGVSIGRRVAVCFLFEIFGLFGSEHFA